MDQGWASDAEDGGERGPENPTKGELKWARRTLTEAQEAERRSFPVGSDRTVAAESEWSDSGKTNRPTSRESHRSVSGAARSGETAGASRGRAEPLHGAARELLAFRRLGGN